MRSVRVECDAEHGIIAERANEPASVVQPDLEMHTGAVFDDEPSLGVVAAAEKAQFDLGLVSECVGATLTNQGGQEDARTPVIFIVDMRRSAMRGRAPRMVACVAGGYGQVSDFRLLG